MSVNLPALRTTSGSGPDRRATSGGRVSKFPQAKNNLFNHNNPCHQRSVFLFFKFPL